MSNIGTPLEIPLDQLELDANNPRLPEDEKGANQEELVAYILDEYEPIVIARSISRYGFFASEPLIVIEAGKRGRKQLYTVVEGNRRLTALLLLADADLRRTVHADDEWAQLGDETEIPEAIPTVVSPSREMVAPIVGYRHISGIEEWDPDAKARFIAHLVDDQGRSFADVALIVGERETDVRSMYRNNAILEQARDDFEVDTTRAEGAFGVFTNAMGSVPIRTFIGAPDPRDVDPDTQPLHEDYAEEVRDLLSWLYGDETNEKVISESRDISRYLTTVLQDDHALATLRETRDLELAYETAGGKRERLVRRLANARGSLRAALEDIDEWFEDEEVIALVDECEQEIKALREAL